MEQFDTIAYLELGNMRQVMAYNTLTNHKVIELLAGYTPLLVGTIPIGIDIEGSDLDILCYCHDKETFINTLKNSFSGKKGFILKDYILNDIPTVKTNFYIDGFEVEVFGQNIPVKEQYGYRHMIIEYKILENKGPEFRNEIIRLKEQGVKTEPAFAQLLGLGGNPYEALLDYKTG